MGNFSIGTASLSVTFTDTEATATATAPSVALGPGNAYQVATCIKAHSIRKSYDTRCDQKAVDTSSNTASVKVAAPNVTATLTRPASAGSGYFSYAVQISTRQADGSYKRSGSSWPDTSLPAASVGVPAVDATSSPTPVREGALLTDGATGGINNGRPDSMCASSQGPDPGPPGDGVSTNALGTDAPAYYEVGEPSGAYTGQPPKGVMLIIHGGGWFVNGPSAVGNVRSDADRWRARGWRTLNITYRPCNQSLSDVLWFYDRARSTWGSSPPYCAMGGSAGGNLALLLAWARPTVSCVDDVAGPTDGTALSAQTTPKGGSDGPRWIYNMLTAAVGPENVMWYSPARLRLHPRVLFAVAANDPFIPWAQGTGLRTSIQTNYPGTYVDLLQLAAGTTPFMHANVSSDSLSSFYDHEQQLVAPLER
jgi:acetyl esterase/lipase